MEENTLEQITETEIETKKPGFFKRHLKKISLIAGSLFLAGAISAYSVFFSKQGIHWFRQERVLNILSKKECIV